MDLTTTHNESIQLSAVEIDENYAKKWNEINRDFIMISRNGHPLRNTLYRIGGMGKPSLKTDNYFLLLKYVEAFYSKEIMDASDRAFGKRERTPNHLEGRWCIIDKFGNEKIEFKQFENPYLIKNSILYSIGGKYFNIETGEFYCETSTSMQTSKYLFLQNRFDKDEKRRGVLKIDKKTGAVELFEE